MREHAIQRQSTAAIEVARHVSEEVGRGQPADQALAAVFRANRHYGSRDRRFYGQLVFSYFRWKGWVDACADFASALKAAFYLDAEAHLPAADALGTISCEPASHLNLAGKAEVLAAWLKLPEPPPPTALVPDWTASELIEDSEPEAIRRFIESIQVRPPLWLRAKQGEETHVLGRLRALGLQATPDPRCPTAIAVAGNPALAPLRKEAAGSFEVQDLASQCVGHACAPRQGDRWWDMCAGAGGKTLHLADLMHDRGAITATDVRAAALRELKHRMRIAGVTCVDTVAHLPTDPHAWPLAGPFDGILIDAPCSGLGTWGRSPDARWRTTHESLQAHAERQLLLLASAAPLLRPGGRLVYSVCSLATSESTRVAERFLAMSPSFRPLPLQHPLLPGQSAAQLAIFPALSRGIGMYIAGFEKIQ